MPANTIREHQNLNSTEQIGPFHAILNLKERKLGKNDLVKRLAWIITISKSRWISKTGCRSQNK